MAFTINAPKNWLLMPFFILLVILTIPFVILFSLLRLPFAKRRTIRLKEIITNDWLPRKKYIYIGYNDDLAIAGFIEREIIPKYKSHIIFDKWSPADNEWTKSDVDTYRRITTVWQDIVGDFDGDPICIVAVLTPEQTEMTEGIVNTYYFDCTKNGSVLLKGEEMSVSDVEKRIVKDIEAGIKKWKN